MNEPSSVELPPAKTNILIEGANANLRYRYDVKTPMKRIGDTGEFHNAKITDVVPDEASQHIESMVLRDKTGSQELDLIQLLPEHWSIGGRFFEQEELQTSTAVRDSGDAPREAYMRDWRKDAGQGGVGVVPKLQLVHLGDFSQLSIEEQRNVPEQALRQVLIARAIVQMRAAQESLKIRGVVPPELDEQLNPIITKRVKEVMAALGDLTKNPGTIAAQPFEDLPKYIDARDQIDDARTELKNAATPIETAHRNPAREKVIQWLDANIRPQTINRAIEYAMVRIKSQGKPGYVGEGDVTAQGIMDYLTEYQAFEDNVVNELLGQDQDRTNISDEELHARFDNFTTEFRADLAERHSELKARLEQGSGGPVQLNLVLNELHRVANALDAANTIFLGPM